MSEQRNVARRFKIHSKRARAKRLLPREVLILGSVFLLAVQCASLPRVQTGSSVAPETRPTADATMRLRVSEVCGKLPMSFEANLGQKAGAVKYLAKGQGYTLFLTPDEAVMVFTRSSGASERMSSEGSRLPSGGGEARDQAVLRMHLVGGSPSPKVTGGSS